MNKENNVMDLMEAADLVAKVQGDISRILLDLEKQIGREISSAEICKLDVTSISDDKQKIIKSFQIKFDPTEHERKLYCY